MGSPLTLDAARRIFGEDLLAPDALAELLGEPPDAPGIPFETRLAEAARADGCLLLYRPANLAPAHPLTLPALFERVGALARSDLRFRGDDPWFLRDPLVLAETPEAGWALVARNPWPETLNATYEVGTGALARRAAGLPWRRRRAVEAAFDTIAFAQARGKALLAKSFDWTTTPSADGGLVTVGGFEAGVLDVVAYSAPVKHGWLGSVPTLVGS
jgi:hypothetical protein